MESSKYTILDFALGLFVKIPDLETHRTRVYPLSMILFCALGTFLCGGKSSELMTTFALSHQDILAKLFGVTDCPSSDIFDRVFFLMNKQLFSPCLLNLSKKFGELFAGEVVAVDEKICRSAKEIIQREEHEASAWSQDTQMTLGLIDLDEQRNDIPAMPEIIKLLGTSISGSVVTADALNTQKATAEAIVQSKANYVLPVNENHASVYEELKPFLDSMADRENPGSTSINKGDGQLEIRKCWQSTKIDCLSSAGDWAGVKSICVIDQESENLVTHEKPICAAILSAACP